jgi:fibronectin type 3 domain-containing protein
MYYNLYWSKNPGVTKKNGTRITNITSPYIHTGLTNEAMYYYVVTEVTGGIEGPESHEIATAPKAVIPVIPTGMSVAPANGAVQVSLDPTSTITTTRFNLYYATDVSLSNLVKLASAFGSTTSFRHAPLKNGASYYYVVTAGELDGESPQSSPVAAQPLADIKAVDYVKDVTQAQIAAPNNITALAGNQLVNLTWNMPTSQIPLVFDPDFTPTQPPVISAFNIYWSTNWITDLAQANKLTLPVVLPMELPMAYTHNAGLVNNSSYYYIISAVADTDVNGNSLKTAKGAILSFESQASSQVSVVPVAKAPVAPTGLSATSGAQKITLIWTPSTTAGATYRLYMSQTAPSQPEDLVNPTNQLAITTTPSYIHTGLQNGSTYYYVVTAVTAGESTPSAIVAVSLR